MPVGGLCLASCSTSEHGETRSRGASPAFAMEMSWMFQDIRTAKDSTPLSRSRFQWRHVTLKKVRESPDECCFCLFTQMGKEGGTEASNENAGLSYIAAASIVHIVHLCQSSVIHHHASSIATCRRPQELCTLCNSVCIPLCVHIT